MNAYSDRYQAALTLAAEAHRTQTRKGGGTPFLVHPVHVSVILLRHGFQEDVVVAGLLHDVVEDTETPLSRIETEFGSPVANIVAALTERKREGGLGRPWELRKREALEALQRASRDAVAVKAADVIHNARSLIAQLRDQSGTAWDYYDRGPDETLWYFGSVAAIVQAELGEHALSEELGRALGDLELTVGEMNAT